MTLLPAKPGLFLCRVAAHCKARSRCYRSPSVRAQATGEPQLWCSPHAQPEGPCEEWWAVPGQVSGEARYLAPDQVDEHRAAGWEVEPALGHHGEAGYHLAVKPT